MSRPGTSGGASDWRLVSPGGRVAHVRAIELDTAGVRLLGEAAGALDQVGQPLGLGAEGVAARRLHLSAQHHRALQRPLSLAEHEDVVVRLERCIARRARSRGCSGTGAGAKDVAGVERHTHRLRERSGRPALRQPGDLGLELGVLGQPVGEEDEVTHGHPLAVGHLARTAHAAHDRDVFVGAERGAGEDADLVLVLQRQVVLHPTR